MDGMKSAIILGVLVDIGIFALLAIDVYLSYEILIAMRKPGQE